MGGGGGGGPTLVGQGWSRGGGAVAEEREGQGRFAKMGETSKKRPGVGYGPHGYPGAPGVGVVQSGGTGGRGGGGQQEEGGEDEDILTPIDDVVEPPEPPPRRRARIPKRQPHGVGPGF